MNQTVIIIPTIFLLHNFRGAKKNISNSKFPNEFKINCLLRKSTQVIITSKYLFCEIKSN
jgi:hypothetical protein